MMAQMHILDWGEAQEVDPMLAACRRYLSTHKDTSYLKWDALLRKYLGNNMDTEDGVHSSVYAMA